MNSADLFNLEDSLLKRFEDGLRIGLIEKEENLTKKIFKKIPIAKKENNNERILRKSIVSGSFRYQYR